MNLLSHLFLRAKHWQIFLFVFALGFVVQVAVSDAIMAGVRSPGEVGRAGLLQLGLVEALTMCIFLLWFWFLGVFLCSLVRPDLKPKIAFFRVTTIYPVLYAFAVPALFVSVNPVLSGALLPLHLLAMTCLIYDLYFVAKCLTLAVTGKPKTFSDFAGTFFLLWFFPIGVWSIQPKVNRLYEARADAVSSAQR
jgi:hypothetical protein